ncbi:MAG: fused MFS/spermidine synthase, partial [Gammaproteobacteria bacterium]
MIRNTPTFPILILLFVILLEGFVTISVEILAIRQLIPFVGNNVIVTSLIIGVFLLFLALGYRRGGSYHENFREILLVNFTKAAIILGIGLSYAFVALFFRTMRDSMVLHPLVDLSIYLLIVLAPLVYILGQTVPITMNLFKGQTIGAISGRVLYLSTLGSFLGAVLTSLLLLNFVGVAWSVFANYLILFFLSFLLVHSFRKNFVRLLILVVGLILVYVLNVTFEKDYFVHTNNYANYRVQDGFEIAPGDVGKAFIVNQSISSFINEAGQGARYVELIKRLLFQELALHNKEILIVGAGGFTLSMANIYGNIFTYVDIDKDIKAVAEEYFIGNIEGEFIVEDARVFFDQTDRRFDVIISDAYQDQRSIPAYLLTVEHFENI